MWILNCVFTEARNINYLGQWRQSQEYRGTEKETMTDNFPNPFITLQHLATKNPHFHVNPVKKQKSNNSKWI